MPTYQEFHFTKYCDRSTGHPGGIQSVMGDGSVRLADASDSFVFDGNSQPIGQPVTFTATVSNSEPVTHAGWGPWEDNPSLSEDLGIAWVSGDGGTRDHGNNDVVLIHNLTGVNGAYGDHDDGWCMGTEIDFPESVHALYDLVV